MKLDKNEIRVGLFIIIPAILLIIFVLIKLGYNIAGSTMDVYLKIDSISSIKKGTAIKTKGYEVGRVVEIRPVYKPALHFLAVMRLEREMVFYEDCSAIIQNQNIIGDPLIELQNPEKKGELLTAGSVIEGIEYVNLEVILQDVHTLLTTASRTIDVFKDMSMESKGNLRVLVANLSQSVMTLRSILENSQRDLISILGNFSETSKTMKEIAREFKRNPWRFTFKGKKDSPKPKK